MFPLFFLRSFGYAGIAVVVIAALGALLVLPALLSVLGPRIDKGQIFARKPADSTHGFWHTTALAVMRRPLVAGLAVIAVLVVLGLPFLNIHFSLPDDRVLPSSAAAQQTQQALRDDFSGRAGEPVIVVAPTAVVAPAEQAAYAARLSRLPGVDAVQPVPGGTGEGFAMVVIPRVEAMSAAAKTLVHDIRRTPAPAPVLVGGQHHLLGVGHVAKSADAGEVEAGQRQGDRLRACSEQQLVISDADTGRRRRESAAPPAPAS